MHRSINALQIYHSSSSTSTFILLRKLPSKDWATCDCRRWYAARGDETSGEALNNGLMDWLNGEVVECCNWEP